MAQPAAKKFKSAVATIAAGGKTKKKLPSIIKKYSSNWSKLGATTAAAVKKKAIH